jgi:peptidoglycan hydrolase CwlO-like protein
MSKVSKEVRIASLQSEIINRVKAIELQKSEKKAMAAGYNDVIKALEGEKLQLLQDLEDAQHEELTEAADEILEKGGSPELARVG